MHALLDHLNLSRVVLAGISMGAATAAKYCCSWPERVRAAIFIRPAWSNHTNSQHLEPLVELGRLLQGFSPEESSERMLRSPAIAEFLRKYPYAVAQLRTLISDPHAARRALRLTQIPAAAPVADWQEVATLKMPVLIVACRNDPFHPIEIAEAWARHVPHARFITISSAWDSPTQHTQELRAALAEFLRAAINL